MILINYLASFFLIVLGLYCIVTKYDLLKSVIGLSIIDYGVNLLIITIGFNPGGTAPIFSFGELNPESFFVDPIPQALTLTSIVIGACVTAMSLSLVIKIREMYGTTDTHEIRRLRG
ncbi:MAG: NADH-quinone oxidoreductase subunit K [Oscillospiraceae bacterium]|jgi:multicomponent Na+:H+ antiporter subunit C|nr:NADH-quinone oxidoreductase subunit K [Oscillospiraceae bacterium]MBQ1363088.1 NADH-quinone oxidoreductase subunit K [Oscillospiraceae bacterium]MBQ1578302.1 NADH-quinone oxidoreductase subunit K [Oscillospiraceae bacterium]MBQ1790951.1 NADH-quinone oxidoreductase subunit K [Oscillospiraceae bacterium]MBQ2072957.1 NADH-quinone oxidoreductase subunit K [Oscillospiraceae bacterium]